MRLQADRRFVELVDAVAREIVSTEHFGSGSLIKTPLLYPSGASVIVQLTEQQDRYFVTDMGCGLQEASMIGAEHMFPRAAKSIADRYGIRFDNQAFFVAEATRGQLAAATTIVANCSTEAAAISAFKAAERRYEDETEALYQRLVKVFPKTAVEKNAEFVGSSNHKWPVAAIVRRNSNLAIFEPVTKNHISVVSAAAKFHDIARLEQAPRRVAVVRSKQEMGDLLNVLAQAASVVEYTASNDVIYRLADAA